MLELAKKGFSSSYKLSDTATGQDHGLVKSDGSFFTGAVTVGAQVYAFTGPPQPGGTYTASENGQPLATATAMADSGRRGYVIEFSSGPIFIEVNGIGQKPFDATNADGTSIGAVSLVGFAGRRITIDLPTTVPFGVQLFAGWLATASYNSAAHTRPAQ